MLPQTRRVLAWLSLGLILQAAPLATAAVEATPPLPFVSSVFADHMVVQRNQPARFWGWTQPGEKVQVTFEMATASSVADATGRWEVAVTTPPAGGPYRVEIKGRETAVLSDVLVGDVWLCSGQSNMHFGLSGANDGHAEVAAANHPRIRFYTMPGRVKYSPATAPEGAWKRCVPESFTGKDGEPSAVAYFFARRVQTSVDVPIGLIQAAVGGSPIESWMDPQGLVDKGHFKNEVEAIDAFRRRGVTEYGNYLSHWFDDFDLGQRSPAWQTADLDTSAWKKVTVPGAFKELGLEDVPAVVWLRREIDVPAESVAGEAKLLLGSVEKMDTAFINGTFIGASSWVENPRAYRVPAGVLRPGKNQVTLRILKITSKEGFLDAPEKLSLAVAHGAPIPLAGEWLGRLSVDARPPHVMPLRFENYPTMPTVLYHGMLEPLAKLPLAGALWYQGEANWSNPVEYRSLLPEMVEQWRGLFAQPKLPFFVVSLPAFGVRSAQPSDEGWAGVREAQLLAAKRVPGVTTIVTVDTGDAANIHPTDKKTVGERLAASVLTQHYQVATPYEGPVYAKASVEGSGMRIHFSTTTGGLHGKGAELAGFAVAGVDRKWVWAKARIEGDTVYVSSPEVPEPVAVRYAWQANPELSLFGEGNLPATPFRTDDW